MITLIDDQGIGAYLRGEAPGEGELCTTGCWYVRLCQAVLVSRGRPGVLARPFSVLPERERRAALRAVLELPDGIGLVSLRDLGPLIGEIRGRHRLNLLSAEVVAAARWLDATVRLSTASPQLETALANEGIAVERQIRHNREGAWPEPNDGV